jgi:cell division protein FtsI/penicillin-binding protein 2
VKKKRTVTTQERLVVVATVLVLWAGGVGARLVHLQVYQHEWYEARAIRQQERTVEVSATRGRLLDRRGRELARSIEARSVYATVADVENVDDAAHRLAKILDTPEATLRERLTSDRKFVCLERKVDVETAEAVEKLGIKGIEFVSEMKRVYPKRELASHVVGFVGVDGDGFAGVEKTYDEQLRGQDGRAILTTDARRKVFDASEIAPTPGDDVHLTIDELAQYRAEQELARGVKETGANWGIAVVMRPQTGEIIALANYPTYDANLFGNAADEVRHNRAVEAVYEPGSVFKIVPYSGCLEEGLVTPDTMIDCQGGSIDVYGRIVHDEPYGVLKASDALAYSSNVAAIKMGMKLGNERLYRYIRGYGFGQRTGVEVPGESPGLLSPVERWLPTTIGSVPMGHEVGVTAVQELAAVSALANGGVWVRPHLVRMITSPDGEVVDQTIPETRRVVSRRTAEQMTLMLEGVVLKGTARHANLDGIAAAGKTGTAQKIDPRTHRYSSTKYTASFCGYAPADDPQLACIVVLDEPHGGGHTGGVTAAPIFGRILENIFADGVLDDGATDPNTLASAATPAQSASSGTQLSAMVGSTPPAAPAPRHDVPEVAVVESDAPADGVVVPDLSGRGFREAVRIGAEAGLVVRTNGSGLVAGQTPAPGAVVAPGAVLTVELRR